MPIKRPARTVEQLHQFAAIRTERRLFARVDFRREMRPIAFVDSGAFSFLIQPDLPEADFGSTSGAIFWSSMCSGAYEPQAETQDPRRRFFYIRGRVTTRYNLPSGDSSFRAAH